MKEVFSFLSAHVNLSGMTRYKLNLTGSFMKYDISWHSQRTVLLNIYAEHQRIPSEMEVVLRYTLPTLLTLFTLFILFKPLYTAQTLANIIYMPIYIVRERYWNGLMRNEQKVNCTEWVIPLRLLWLLEHLRRKKQDNCAAEQISVLLWKHGFDCPEGHW